MRRWTGTGGLAVAAVVMVIAVSGCVVKGTWTETPLAESFTVTRALDVSCVTADECMALVTDGASRSPRPHALQRFNGSSWTEVARPAEDLFWGDESQIECWAPDACMTIASWHDESDLPYLAMRWDGTSWTWSSFVGEYTDRLDCSSAGKCLAYSTHGVGDPRVYDGTAWDEDVTLPTAWEQRYGSVDCAAPLLCVKVPNVPSDGPEARHLDVETGAMTTVPFPVDIWATDVDCVSATSCVAVGRNGAASWDGTAWTTRQLHPTGTALAVDCAKASECVAVGVKDLGGGQREVVTRVWFGGGEWTSNATAAPASVNASLTTIKDVSCASGQPLCVIVGNDAAGEGVAVSYTWG